MTAICPDCGKFTLHCPLCHKTSCEHCGWNEQVKPTNADRIRSMTDGELAEFIHNIATTTIKGVYCHSLGKNGTEKRGCYSDDHWEDCVECALDWLQQPGEVKL